MEMPEVFQTEEAAQAWLDANDKPVTAVVTATTGILYRQTFKPRIHSNSHWNSAKGLHIQTFSARTAMSEAKRWFFDGMMHGQISGDTWDLNPRYTVGCEYETD